MGAKPNLLKKPDSRWSFALIFHRSINGLLLAETVHNAVIALLPI